LGWIPSHARDRTHGCTPTLAAQCTTLTLKHRTDGRVWVVGIGRDAPATPEPPSRAILEPGIYLLVCSRLRLIPVTGCSTFGRTVRAPSFEYGSASRVYRHLRLAAHAYMCGLPCGSHAGRRAGARRALQPSPLRCSGHSLAGTGGDLCVSLLPP
jgi:hypothetical protein